MKVDNIDNKFFIEFNKNILNEKEIVELVEYLKIKETIYKSKLQKEEVEKLDNELKYNWWCKNKEVILGKIDDSKGYGYTNPQNKSNIYFGGKEKALTK